LSYSDCNIFRVPFRQFSNDDLTLESPLPSHSSPDGPTQLSLDDHIHRSIIDGLQVHQRSVVSRGRGKTAPPTGDAELLVSMAQRLGEVERELLDVKREVIEKVWGVGGGGQERGTECF
jgi:hypothetical protein